MKIKVSKASGAVEELNSDKLRASLIRSGADREQSDEIIKKILAGIESLTSTKKIYKLAKKYLRQYNHASSLRYSLKRAIFGLGPSGYPFEKYCGELLKQYGYQVSTGVLLEGKCVKHEVDILAIKNNEISIIECKYHTRAGLTTDVKIALYVHSRVQDIKPIITSQHPEKIYIGWLVTNTRCTSEAIQYAECAGLRVKSWRYPDNASIENMIEEKRLYPVTVLSDVKTGLIRRLIERDIILLRDLSAMDIKTIQSLLSLPEQKAAALKKQADEVCLC